MSDTFTYDVTVKAERLNELRFFWPFWTKAFVNGEVKRVQVPAGFYRVRLKSSGGLLYVENITNLKTQYEGELFPVLGLIEGDTRKRPGIAMPWNLNSWTSWLFIAFIVYVFAKRKKRK